MKETTVVCHECHTPSSYFVTEWPPEVFVCAKCSSIFKLIALSPLDEPTFDLTGYCRNAND